MIEKFIKENSGDYKKTDLFHKLPKKVTLVIFNTVLQYLLDNNKIGIDKKDYVVYIWNPELVEKYKDRKRY